MTTETLNLTTPTGKQVTVQLGETLNRPRLQRVEVDGEHVGSGDARISTLKSGMPPVVAGYIVCGRKMVGFDQESVDRLQSAIDDLRVEIDARLEVRMEPLIGKREQLALRLAGAMEDDDRRRKHAWEAGDERGGVDGSESENVKQARKALAEFDDEHPEVIAEIKRRRDEATERGLWR